MLKKTDIALNIYQQEGDYWGKTNSFLDIEDDKTLITLKIKKLGSNKWNRPNWVRAYRTFATYTIEPLEFTFLDKIENVKNNTFINLPNEGQKVKVGDVGIVYENLKNAIPLNEIFYEGAEIKLRLKNNPKIGEDRQKYDYWLLGDNRDRGKDDFRLEIYSDYEIITPKGTISFPQLTYEEEQELGNRENRELREKWSREKEGYAYERFNNIYQDKDKNQVESINLSSQGLRGTLKIENFPNLKSLNLADNQLTELEISNCPQLKDCNISDNPNLTLLTVEKLSKFDRLINNNSSLEIIETEKTDEEEQKNNEETPIFNNTKRKKEAILNNLTEWCVGPMGDFAFAKPFMNQKYYDINDYWHGGSSFVPAKFNNPPAAEEPKNITWDKDKEKLTPDEEEEIRQAFLQEIKDTPQDWKIKKEGKLWVIIHKSGRKHWHWGNNLKIDEEKWQELEQLIPNNNWNLKDKLLLGGGILLVVFILYLLVRKYFF